MNEKSSYHTCKWQEAVKYGKVRGNKRLQCKRQKPPKGALMSCCATLRVLRGLRK